MTQTQSRDDHENAQGNNNDGRRNVDDCGDVAHHDTVGDRGRRSGQVTMVDRQSGYIRIRKAANLKSTTTRRAARKDYTTNAPAND
jgi:hypothetical protein